MTRIAAVLLLLLVTGCANSYRGISVTPGDAGVQTPAIATFEVKADSLPAFLGPILVSNFSVAMAERGLQPVMQNGDAIATLHYVQDDLVINHVSDPFDERIDQGGDTRFIAKIVVDVHVRASNELIWTGSIQRLHNVRPGDYMHTGRASVALLEAFRDLLQSYPGPVTTDASASER